MTQRTEINGCLVSHSADHKQAHVTFPKGRKPESFESCQRSTGFYKAQSAAKGYLPSPSPGPA